MGVLQLHDDQRPGNQRSILRAVRGGELDGRRVARAACTACWFVGRRGCERCSEAPVTEHSTAASDSRCAWHFTVPPNRRMGGRCVVAWGWAGLAAPGAAGRRQWPCRLGRRRICAGIAGIALARGTGTGAQTRRRNSSRYSSFSCAWRKICQRRQNRLQECLGEERPTGGFAE